MYEKMLIPLDGSKVAESVLPHVEDLVSKMAPGLEVIVTLFQVLSPTHYIVAGGAGAPVPYTEVEIEQIKKYTVDYLNKMAEGLRSRGATVQCQVAVGQAAEEIIKTADEVNTDVIAMSTHGRSGLSRWAFGSVADRVLRASNRPVLLVRAPKEVAETSP